MKTVFVVDDNETNRIMAKGALEGAYRSYAMPSSERLFKMADKIMPDLVLLDVDMPGTDGLETVRLMRADERLAAVPIIMFSASDFDDVVKQCLAFGANDFVAKPFTPARLLAQIGRYI